MIENRCHHCGQLMIVKNITIPMILDGTGMVHSVQDVTLDFGNLVAKKCGKPVKITKGHWRLLAVLIAANGDIVTRDYIFTVCYETKSTTNRSVDTHVAEIRKRIGNVIGTVHGIGYRWVDGR